MKRLVAGLIALVASAAVAASEPAEAVAADEPVKEWSYGQVWLGALGTDEAWELEDQQSGEGVLGDLGTLPFGGGAGQRMWGAGRWQIGYEGGALATWKSDETKFRGSNGSLRVTIDNTYFSFGVFMGGVVSVAPMRNLRLYAAAGPSVTWAWVDDDDDDDDDPPTPLPPGTNFVIDFEDGNNDVSIVPYARAGIEIVLNDGFAFGVSVRYADDEFDFDNSGQIELDDPMWLLTLGGRM